MTENRELMTEELDRALTQCESLKVTYQIARGRFDPWSQQKTVCDPDGVESLLR